MAGSGAEVESDRGIARGRGFHAGVTKRKLRLTVAAVYDHFGVVRAWRAQPVE
jgi:hypothetical protein